MTVRYHHRREHSEPEYVCQAKGIEYGSPICQRVHGAVVDAAVGTLLINALTPHALETAIAVADELATRADTADALRATAVERTRHHAELARRRFLAVDPDNRLVAARLEADWNTTLRELAEATETYEKARNKHAAELNDQDRARITALAADFPTLWNDPDTPDRERKRLTRLLITDVTLIRDAQITAHVRLRGGQEHTLTMPVHWPPGRSARLHHTSSPRSTNYWTTTPTARSPHSSPTTATSPAAADPSTPGSSNTSAAHTTCAATPNASPNAAYSASPRSHAASA
jgi:hypothetical protein